jgi:cyclohexanone monooxygenase
MRHNADFDVIVIGAGFAGVYALHRLRSQGLKVRVLDAAAGVGGTWYWNRYPGARCDVESLEYAYSFNEQLTQQWNWTERYATQPEILRYIEHVVDRFDLASDIQLNTRVESLRYEDSVWLVQAEGFECKARYVVMASGCLSVPNQPSLPGLEEFAGTCVHTGKWPREDIDLNGKRVAVIGTGSSGVQLISEIAPRVEHLTVFQRTPHWVVPSGNRPLTAAEQDEYRGEAQRIRKAMQQSFLGMRFANQPGAAIDASEDERQRRYQAAWETGGSCYLGCFEDLLVNMDSNATARAFIARKIQSIVHDPRIAEMLTPSPDSYALGAKRLVQDDRYYATYNRDNVELIDTRANPIEQFTASSILTAGSHHPVEVIVLATGFDAVTGALLKIDIVGRNGQALKEKWSDGPHTFLGVGMAGFPNLFMITGPGSPSVLSNMVLSIEQHVDWISKLIGYADAHGIAVVEPMEKSELEWGEKVRTVAEQTLFLTADSWYVGANIPGKPRVIMPYLGGVGPYRDECDQIAASGYSGFSLG